MTIYDAKPSEFLKERCRLEDGRQVCITVCAGYETKSWRSGQLASHLIQDWLLEFSLRYSELEGLNHANFGEMFKRAAQFVYTSPKHANRGEIDEIMLHAVCRQFFNTLPVVAKFYFKDTPNDTVKGYDAIHIVVGTDDELELWLGEVKFYKVANDAVRDVLAEIADHISPDYLRSEFMAVSAKLDENMPFYSEVRDLIHGNTSLDEVFSKLVIPIFISYESPSIKSSTEISQDLLDKLKEESEKIFNKFNGKFIDFEIRIFIFPMRDKSELVNAFDSKLKSLQEGMK